MREIIVIGAGPGAAEHVTPAASEAIMNADRVLAAPRCMELAAGHKNAVEMRNFNEAFDRAEREDGSVAVIVSGDPGIYSLLPLVRRRFPDVPLRVLPGISSLQSLCASACEMWEGAAILSGHGRPLSRSKLLITAERNARTILFCGGAARASEGRPSGLQDKIVNEKRTSSRETAAVRSVCTPQWVCRELADACGGLGSRVDVVIGERLSYPDERVTRIQAGSGLAEAAERVFDPLSVMMIRNPSPYVMFGRPRDDDFIRSADVPMTREEVRSVIIDKLRLAPDAVMWDIGAGTGSVSAAAALECPDGEVHSVECSGAALELLARNREKFRLHNMNICAGIAPEALDALPDPTHVFIGGSGGRAASDDASLTGILRAVSSRGRGIRVVVSAVTLETLSAAFTIMNGDGFCGFGAVQISVSAGRQLGGSTLMAARNPVTVLYADTER